MEVGRVGVSMRGERERRMEGGWGVGGGGEGEGQAYHRKEIKRGFVPVSLLSLIIRRGEHICSVKRRARTHTHARTHIIIIRCFSPT